MVTIANPNPYPVTVAAVQLPTNTTYTTGYTTSRADDHPGRMSGCDPERGHLELLHRNQR